MPSGKNLWQVALLLLCLSVSASGQTGGVLKGKVTLADQQAPLHNAIIVVTQLKRSATTDEKGEYEIKDVPPGNYSVVARLDRMPDAVSRVEVKAGETVTVDFEFKLQGLRDQVTVSATGNAQTAFEAFQSVTSMDATTLLEKNPLSLGDVLEHQPGVAKRSSGPGSARPVIRGFDGDRVLIAQDGIRSGSLSYSSGDHGEPVNVLSVERVEVVRGPATLLYGSSAIGGMVNAVSGHEDPHAGLRGFVSGFGSSNNAAGGASAGIEIGGKKWLAWGNGGGQRAGDYQIPLAPLGKVINSRITRNYDVMGGAGYYGGRGFFSGSYSHNRNRYGIPVDPDEEDAEVAALDIRRHNLRVNGGFNKLSGPFDHVHLTFDYTDYKHQELVDATPETSFFNKTASYRAIAEQKSTGRFSGTVGVSGFRRDFKTIGEEALAPPTIQHSFAVFGLETIDFERIAFQFGARVERNDYSPDGAANLRDRSFTGFSGSLGVRVPLWTGGAFAANYTHSYRAPSLDELYNFGPHPGNLTFEIGDDSLTRESGDGFDLSLRHSSNRLRGEGHFFSYKLSDFIFLAPTGNSEDGFPEAAYRQANSRFTGAEVDLNFGLRKDLWLNAGLDYVKAELTATNTPLPRIPPLRGRVGLDWQYKGFRFNPEAVLAHDQNRLFTNEARTAGYGVINVLAGYTFAQQHAAHIFSVNGFNLGNKLYFNHLSFIKAFAPEIGRGVRFTYTVRFF